MAIRPRARKRVEAVRRAPDGSAFEKCEDCGVMIAIALFDMHECGEKRREVKRFKCVSSGGEIDNISKPSFDDEPRSPFVFFLEDFRKSYGGNMVEATRICFTVWKNMSGEDQRPYIARAVEVDLAHNRKLKEESIRIYKADDEADSKDVGKSTSTQFYDRYEEEEGDSSDHFEHEFLWDDDTLPSTETPVLEERRLWLLLCTYSRILNVNRDINEPLEKLETKML